MRMNYAKKIISLFLVFSLLSIKAEAIKRGGVSDGGGDSIGASPVTPVDLAAVALGANTWLFPWLYKQQSLFFQQDAQAQVSSPFRKMFADSSKDIFHILKTSSVELRDTQPCFDRHGQPKDGSIYGKWAQQICLSTYLLSQKTNSNNFAAEVVALMVHEYSHFLGTSEEEAVAIQTAALKDFNSYSLLGVKRHLSGLLAGPQGGRISKLYGPLQNWQQDPKNYTSGRDLLYWNQSWGELYAELSDEEQGILQFLPAALLSEYGAYNYKIAVMIAYYHANDTSTDVETRRLFQQQIDVTFANKEVMTAREIVQMREGWDPGASYDLVSIKKPATWQDQAAVMQDLVVFLQKIQKSLEMYQSL